MHRFGINKHMHQSLREYVKTACTEWKPGAEIKIHIPAVMIVAQVNTLIIQIKLSIIQKK